MNLSASEKERKRILDNYGWDAAMNSARRYFAQTGRSIPIVPDITETENIANMKSFRITAMSAIKMKKISFPCPICGLEVYIKNGKRAKCSGCHISSKEKMN